MSQRVLGHDALARDYADALALFDTQCPHLSERDDVNFYLVKQRRLHARAGHHGALRAYWDPVGAWIRYSCGFSHRGKPRKKFARVQVRGMVGHYEAGEVIRGGDLVTIGEDGRLRRATGADAIGYAVEGTAGDRFSVLVQMNF